MNFEIEDVEKTSKKKIKTINIRFNFFLNHFMCSNMGILLFTR